jgi:hypothetical protein
MEGQIENKVIALEAQIRRLDDLSLKYSVFIEGLELGEKVESAPKLAKEKPILPQPPFKELYHDLPRRLSELCDRFEMHLGILTEMIY